MAECMLCGAPGGWPYCDRECEDADQDETESEARDV